MKVRFAPIVATDLAGISEHLERHEVDRPERVFDRLHEACLALGEMPERFSLAPRFENEGVRRRVVGNYLIFYRVQGKQVAILRILHGAQDYESLLFGEP